MANNRRLTLVRSRERQTPTDLPSSSILALRGVSKTFHPRRLASQSTASTVALHEVDLSIRPGEVIGLAGESGSGKTTLGLIISGLLRPDTGLVMLGPYDLYAVSDSDFRQFRKWIRFVPHNPASVLLPDVKVREVLKAGLPEGNGTNEVGKHYLDHVDLFNPDWLNSRVGNLSVGQMRRVINLRALCSQPRFLILDEPFNGLDPRSRAATVEALRSIARIEETGLLIISHQTRTLSSVCDVIFTLADGMLKKGSNIPATHPS